MDKKIDRVVTVTAEVADKRLDNFLGGHFAESRSYFSDLISSGNVTLNGKQPKKSDSVKVGDELVVSFPKEVLPDLTPRKIDFEVVHDTANYAIINKPAGITVHPAPGHYDDSLVNGILYAFAIEDDTDTVRPGIVHRLDKDTSGLLIVAKNRNARETLSRLFQDRKINKYYYAVAGGKPTFKVQVVEQPIARDKVHRQRMAVSADGKLAKTKVTVKEVYNGAFLADIELFTGRTHQIRVHMKHINHPLLGDSVYANGNIPKLFDRQALHAYRLSFVDPFDGSNVDVSAPLPDDMQALVDRLKGQ